MIGRVDYKDVAATKKREERKKRSVKTLKVAEDISDSNSAKPSDVSDDDEHDDEIGDEVGVLIGDEIQNLELAYNFQLWTNDYMIKVVAII